MLKASSFSFDLLPTVAFPFKLTLGTGMLALLACPPLSAQSMTPTPDHAGRLQLKISRRLSETAPNNKDQSTPTFVLGDQISGRPDLETVVEGNAELRQDATSLKAEKIEYYQPDNTLKAQGDVRIQHAGNAFSGPELKLKLTTFEGFFNQPNYRLINGGNGKAARIDFIDDQRLIARQVSYTSCERGNEASWRPAWELRAETVRFDLEESVGVATGAVLRFQDVPFLTWPGDFSFPLSDKRKSGFLPPGFGADTTSGLSVSLPYYFDIAPNRDATFIPTFFKKRGLDLAGDFRYLENNGQGQLRGNFLPNDTLREQSRWAYSYQHTGSFNSGLSRVGNVGLSLNLNRVSDDNYWRDFPRGNTALTQRLLSNDASLSWSQDNAAVGLRTLKWQTLQDVSAPIVPPYDRLPQLTANYSRSNAPLAGINGIDWSVDTDYTRFASQQALTLQPNADRLFARGKISRPWVWPAGSITPALQLHATQYQFNAPLANGASTASRVLPTFSLDAGLQFEREASYFGRSFTQTLEPRAFYVRTPYKDQSLLPNYDSGANDFNFATVFTENAFVGNDRISDANLLTLGTTSRFLDPSTGAEAVRLGIAQRLRFSDQKVTLPGVAVVSDRFSDLLLGASTNWTPQWSFDVATQYNPKLSQSERTTVGARYSPSNYRVISAAYRRQRDVSEQFDMGWQWPVNDLWGDKGQDLGPGKGQGGRRWYSVGRLNYSVPDKKLVDAVIGFEYDGCCWIGRAVLQRSTNGASTSNTQILFQLEFVGFSRLGNSPLATLKSNIPRYQYLREQVARPSRFTNYD